MKDKRDPAAVKLYSEIVKLERKIEATMSDQPKDGFSLNKFGSYDRSDLVASVHQLYKELIAKGSADDSLMYQFAGFLFRSCQFKAAHEIYSAQLDRSTPAHVMLASVCLAMGDEKSALQFLESYNKRCVTESMPFMQSSMEKLRGHR